MINTTNNKAKSSFISTTCPSKNISLFPDTLSKSAILALEKQRSDALYLRHDVRKETKMLYFAMTSTDYDFIFSKSWLIDKTGRSERIYRQCISELKNLGFVGNVFSYCKETKQVRTPVVLTSRVDEKTLSKKSAVAHCSQRDVQKCTLLVNKQINNNTSSKIEKNSDLEKRVQNLTNEVREILDSDNISDAHIITACRQSANRYKRDDPQKVADTITRNNKSKLEYLAEMKSQYCERGLEKTSKTKIKPSQAFYTNQTYETLAETVKHSLRTLDYGMGVDQKTVSDALIADQSFNAFERYGKYSDVSVIAMTVLAISYFETLEVPEEHQEVYKVCPDHLEKLAASNAKLRCNAYLQSTFGCSHSANTYNPRRAN